MLVNNWKEQFLGFSTPKCPITSFSLPFTTLLVFEMSRQGEAWSGVRFFEKRKKKSPQPQIIQSWGHCSTSSFPGCTLNDVLQHSQQVLQEQNVVLLVLYTYRNMQLQCVASGVPSFFQCIFPHLSGLFVYLWITLRSPRFTLHECT